MRVYHRAIAIAGLSALGMLVAFPAGAAGFRASASRNGVSLNADDTRMMEGAINQALEQHRKGASENWANSATKRAGQATVTDIYERDAQPCGMIEHVFTKGGGNRYVLPYCHQKDGSWKIQY